MGFGMGRPARRPIKVILSATVTVVLLAALASLLLTLRSMPKAFAGYTLVTPLRSTATYLVDMQGRVVRTWESEYTAGQVAYLLENGHVLRAGQLSDKERLFASPAAGGRLQEFTWDGELIWDFKLHNDKQVPHHDFTRLPNGNILLLLWSGRRPRKPSRQDAGRTPWTAPGLPTRSSRSSRRERLLARSCGNGVLGTI